MAELTRNSWINSAIARPPAARSAAPQEPARDRGPPRDRAARAPAGQL